MISNAVLLRGETHLTLMRLASHWAKELDCDPMELAKLLTRSALNGDFDSICTTDTFGEGSNAVATISPTERMATPVWDGEQIERVLRLWMFSPDIPRRPPLVCEPKLPEVLDFAVRWNCLLFRRDAVLKFASDRQLEPPSWWASEPGAPAASCPQGPARALPPVARVVAYLATIADGPRAESEWKQAAMDYFGCPLPDKNIWRPAWKAFASEFKLKRGQHRKSGR